jgi:hypothetical protein
MTTITDEYIRDWKVNYGLDQRSPADAMRWWNDNMNGMAPAGAVAALGLLIQEREALKAELANCCGAEMGTLSPVISQLEAGDVEGALKMLRRRVGELMTGTEMTA